MWWDPINYVFRKPGGYGCLDEGTSAQTYYLKDPGVDEGVTIGGQNPDRAVITVSYPPPLRYFTNGSSNRYVMRHLQMPIKTIC